MRSALITTQACVILGIQLLFLGTSHSTEFNASSTGNQSPAVVVQPNAKATINYNVQKANKAFELLQAAKSFENAKDAKKMLEFAKKAYTEDKTFPDALYTYALALVVSKNEGKARELLIENSYRLNGSEKALLGVVQFQAQRFDEAFSLLSHLDLTRLPERIEAHAIRAYAISALQTQPYQDALTHVQNALLATETMKAFYSSGTKITVLRDDRMVQLKMDIGGITRLNAVEFDIAFGLIDPAAKNGDNKNIIPIIKLAKDGFSRTNGLVDDNKLRAYMRWFNRVLSNDENLVKNNVKLIDECLAKFIEAFSNRNDKTDRLDKQKAKLLANLIADTFDVGVKKQDIVVSEAIRTRLNTKMHDGSGVRSVVMSLTAGDLTKTEILLDNGKETDPIFTNAIDIPPGVYGKDKTYTVLLTATDRAGNTSKFRKLPQIEF